MRGFKEIYVFFITLLEIAVLVKGTDYEATNTFNGELASIEIPNHDFNKNQAIPSSHFPQNSPNFAPDLYSEKGNHQRNTREITNEDPITNLHSSIQDNLIKENTDRNTREASYSRIDTNNFDTGSMFDTSIFNEDTEQETCIRENPDRITRGVSESMISSNILDSLKDTCHQENSRRNVRQVIDSNILNQNEQDLEREIPKELTSLNHFNVDEIPDHVGQIFDKALEENSKLTVDQDDVPLNLNKLVISTNLVPNTLKENFEKSCYRNERDISNNEPNLNQNFDVVESNHRNLRDIDSIEETPNQNLKNIDPNQGFDEHNNRIVRGVDDTSFIEPNRDLNNLDLDGKIVGNNQRAVREVIDEAPTMESSDTLEKNEMRDLTNLQKITDSDSYENGENLKENARNTREIVQSSQMDLNKDMVQDSNKIDDRYLGIPSNLASNSGEILGENVERNSREIQRPTSIESDVFNQKMDVNEGEKVENVQTIVGERKSREVQDSSLIDSDVSNQIMSKKEEEDNENNERIVREASNVNENVENESFERKMREISGESEMLRSSIFGENDFNPGSNFEKLKNLDPTIFNDDESLVDDSNIRSIREIGDRSPNKDESDLDENEENFERKAREISDGNGQFGFNEGQTFDEHRAVRNIPDFNYESGLEVSNENGERRNTRETSELSGTLDLKSKEGDLRSEEGDNIEADRFVRDLPTECATPLSNVFNQENIEQFRKIREIYEENKMVETNGDDVEENRNTRDVSVEYRTPLSNVLNQDTANNELRNIREISEENEGSIHDSSNQKEPISDGAIRENLLTNPSLNSNFIKQASGEARDIRDISVETPGFNPDIFKQEPIVIGENRNGRDISSESTGFYQNIPNFQEPLVIGENRNLREVSMPTGFYQNIPKLKEPIVIGDERSVRDIDSRTEKMSFFDKKGDENEELEQGIEMKREARSCKKKNSHHNNDSSDKPIHDKQEPLQASLSMMNVRIVKSKDDSKFLDDATENLDGENKEGKKKKKKICRVKHLHVLQPLKTKSKIVESPRKKEGNNLRNSTARSSRTFIKVLKATLDKNEGDEEEEGEGVEEDEDEEKEMEEESRIRKDEEEREFDESRAKSKPAKKSKMNFDSSKIKKDRERFESRIILSSPLTAENVPKRVFGGTKKFVLSENHPQNYVPKNRKSLFKKERLKNDDPTFLVGLEIKKELKKEKEEEEGNENGNDFDDVEDSSAKVDNIDEPCQTVAVAPSNSERLKLKDLKNFSEAINVSDAKRKQSENKLDGFDKKLRKFDEKVDNIDNKLNNFDREKNIDKNRESDKQEEEEEEEEEVEEEEEEEGVEREEEESEEEDRGLKKKEKHDENGEGEEEKEVAVKGDEFEENADLGENYDIDGNTAD